jgi:hypothetical protein
MVIICNNDNSIMIQIGNTEFIKNIPMVKIKYMCMFCNSKKEVFINYKTGYKTIYK